MLGDVPWGPPPFVPSHMVMDSQQPLSLDLFLLFFSPSLWATLLTAVWAVGPALTLWLQGPLPAGGGGQAWTGGVMAERTCAWPSGRLLPDQLPRQGEWELPGPGSRPGSATNTGFPAHHSSALSLSFLRVGIVEKIG